MKGQRHLQQYRYVGKYEGDERDYLEYYFTQLIRGTFGDGEHEASESFQVIVYTEWEKCAGFNRRLLLKKRRSLKGTAFLTADYAWKRMFLFYNNFVYNHQRTWQWKKKFWK